MLNICTLLGSNLIIRDIRVRTLLTTCDLIDFLCLTAEQTKVSSHPLQSMRFPGLGTGLRNGGSSSSLGRTSVVQECDSSSGWTDKRTRLKLYHEVPPFCID